MTNYTIGAIYIAPRIDIAHFATNISRRRYDMDKTTYTTMNEDDYYDELAKKHEAEYADYEYGNVLNTETNMRNMAIDAGYMGRCL